jgi:hypothetical protein
MPTVPGQPDDSNVVNLVPKHLQPTQADFLLAAALMHQQGKFSDGGEYQVAGDVVPFQPPAPSAPSPPPQAASQLAEGLPTLISPEAFAQEGERLRYKQMDPAAPTRRK